ncbi:MAG: hypothetical protein IKM44_01480 [Clostridia bacterium]|nr:hypothetical protein [Clostridia bacterium]
MSGEHLRPVTDDLYFIASRLKEIDPTYYVVYNLIKLRYEVHSKEQRGNTLCFVVPYGNLDARTIEYAKRTRNPSFGKARSWQRR